MLNFWSGNFTYCRYFNAGMCLHLTEPYRLTKIVIALLLLDWRYTGRSIYKSKVLDIEFQVRLLASSNVFWCPKRICIQHGTRTVTNQGYHLSSVMHLKCENACWIYFLDSLKKNVWFEDARILMWTLTPLLSYVFLTSVAEQYLMLILWKKYLLSK